MHNGTALCTTSPISYEMCPATVLAPMECGAPLVANSTVWDQRCQCPAEPFVLAPETENHPCSILEGACGYLSEKISSAASCVWSTVDRAVPLIPGAHAKSESEKLNPLPLGRARLTDSSRCRVEALREATYRLDLNKAPPRNWHPNMDLANRMKFFNQESEYPRDPTCREEDTLRERVKHLHTSSGIVHRLRGDDPNWQDEEIQETVEIAETFYEKSRKGRKKK